MQTTVLTLFLEEMQISHQHNVKWLKRSHKQLTLACLIPVWKNLTPNINLLPAPAHDKNMQCGCPLAFIYFIHFMDMLMESWMTVVYLFLWCTGEKSTLLLIYAHTCTQEYNYSKLNYSALSGYSGHAYKNSCLILTFILLGLQFPWLKKRLPRML